MSVLILTIVTFSPQNDFVNLTETEDRKIFRFEEQRFNPYASDSISRYKFHIPKSIDVKNNDIHGQLQSSFLDKIFHYVPVDLSNGRIEYGGSITFNRSITPNLNEPLKKWLADRFKERDLFDAQYQYFKKCSTSFCTTYFKELQTQQGDWYGKGLDITSLDTSIALIFGKKTTIGQVCSFVKGLKDRMVVDAPGFCCLDAPYSSSDWGEKVKIVTHEIMGTFLNEITHEQFVVIVEKVLLFEVCAIYRRDVKGNSKEFHRLQEAWSCDVWFQ